MNSGKNVGGTMEEISGVVSEKNCDWSTTVTARVILKMFPNELWKDFPKKKLRNDFLLELWNDFLKGKGKGHFRGYSSGISVLEASDRTSEVIPRGSSEDIPWLATERILGGTPKKIHTRTMDETLRETTWGFFWKNCGKNSRNICRSHISNA